MRSIAELGALRPELHHGLSWPLLMSLLAEAEDADGAPFTRSIFELGRRSDISPARITPLLDELAEIDAIAYVPVGDARTVQIQVF